MIVEEWVERTGSYRDTFDVVELHAVSVFSQSGVRLGIVDEVRVRPNSLQWEGIVVNRGAFMSRVYFGRSYITKISPYGVVLSIEPTYLLIGKRVITSDGKVLGKIHGIERADATNEIKNIQVKSLFHKPLLIEASHLKFLGHSIVLKESYDVIQKSLRQ